MDEDSEAEKLSPLLDKSDTNKTNNLALNMEDVVESIDDADTDQDDHISAPEKLKYYGMPSHYTQK